MKKSRETDAFLASKRARKSWRRRQREAKAEHISKDRKADVARIARIRRLFAGGWRLSDHLHRLGLSAAIKPRGPVAEIKIPKTFSIIEDPELALKTIGNLAAAGARTDVLRINFDHSDVEHFDLAAEAILMRVAREIETERRNVEHELDFEGQYPKSQAAKRFAAAMGIGVYLEAQRRAAAANDGSIQVFQQRQRVPISVDGSTTSEKAEVIEAFADHINACLQSINKKLSPDGRKDLCAYTGEVIDNVEEHAGSRAWFIASYLDTAVSPPTCEVTIYNFGRSFADSFSDLPADSYARKIVEPYIDEHKRGGFFQPSWIEADLLTLVALQAGISSKSTSDFDTRGHGSIDLIEFFEDVYEACRGTASSVGARMALLSGSTYILFDGTYRLTKDSDGRQIIAFNDENSLGKAPNRKYVRHLSGVFFPGTVVSIRFPLQQTDRSKPVADGGKS